MLPNPRRLNVRAGFASETGPRERNEDYAGVCLPTDGPALSRGVAAVVADGVGGHRGGRVAAETTVRGFLDAFYAMPETLGVPAAAARALASVNGWVFAQGRRDPELAGMASTFSGLILRHRTAHVVHVGDSRVYKLRDGAMELLTSDHVLGAGRQRHVLTRGIGLDDPVKFDVAMVPLHPGDRFLLCSDGVHGSLHHRQLAALLSAAGSPDEVARAIVAAALAAGGSDNATALVLEVVAIPAAQMQDLAPALAALPLRDMPRPGTALDGFQLGDILADGRNSRLFDATDTTTGQRVVVKFPHPRAAADPALQLAFLREAWVATRVRHPGLGEAIELAPGRQTQLYSAAPFYDGETLEVRLRRDPPVSLDEGSAIATSLARAIAALHRAGIVHRDIKPENVILLHAGGLRLIDLGVARLPNLEDFADTANPGTPAYMAPELFAGVPGNEASDLYALGVTLYRMFARRFPDGGVEPRQRSNSTPYLPLTQARPGLPASLDAALSHAVSVDPEARQGDVLELAHAVENAATWPARGRLARPLYAKNPLLVWQGLCALLAIACLVLLARR